MQIVEKFEYIEKDISKTFEDYYLEARKVDIIAVSKFQTVQKITELLDYGHHIFGENRFQEAQEKWPALKTKYANIELHMIGHMQSNKLKQACDLFDVLQNIDRKSLIDGLVKYRDAQGSIPKIFLQVNTGRETQKGGCLPEDLPELITYARDHQIEPEGLMCIPPAEELAVYHFTMLKNLAKNHNISKTSMGMTADYRQAIICQTDYIRVGTAIFGAREQ
ncbi:MAG: YggS family pyridoxal phosphate-dependent enzyme [Pseudomonadota bacterium]